MSWFYKDIEICENYKKNKIVQGLWEGTLDHCSTLPVLAMLVPHTHYALTTSRLSSQQYHHDITMPLLRSIHIQCRSFALGSLAISETPTSTHFHCGFRVQKATSPHTYRDLQDAVSKVRSYLGVNYRAKNKYDYKSLKFTAAPVPRMSILCTFSRIMHW